MPKLTLDAVRDIQASFKGRITSAHDAQTEFPGATTVLIPESVKDIERGLQLAQASNRLLFVRSGRSISAVDVTDPAAAVLSLETFRDVKVSKGRISVGAATTTADVADRLRNKNLFLPLVDNGTQTIVSAVLRKARPAFLRSRRTVDALRDSVFEAEVVPTDGAGAGRARTVRNKALRDVLDGHRPAVITRLVLDADAAKGGESARWTLIWTAAYKPKALAALCGALFGADTRNIPKRNDLSVRVTSAAYSMKLVIVRATGHGETAPLEAYVQAAFRKAKVRVLESTQEHGPGSSVAAWVATGPGEAASDEIVSRFGSDSAPRPFRSFRAAFLRAVEFAVDATARRDRGRAPGVRGWAELQLGG